MVFCSECEHFNGMGMCINKNLDEKDGACDYLDNIELGQPTWYARVSTKKYIRNPSEINKNNDCSWFSKKISKSML